MIVKKGSLVIVKSFTLLGRAVRFFQEEPGEENTITNHIGLITSAGTMDALIVEALRKVKKHTIKKAYGKSKNLVSIYQPLHFANIEIDRVCEKALSYVGKRYGYGKIIAHFFDWMVGGKYIFRKLCRKDNYPICSWITAYAFDEVGYRFLGLPPSQSQPDDQYDHIRQNPDEWEELFPLTEGRKLDAILR